LGDQSESNMSNAQFDEMETDAASCESDQQMMPQPLCMQTDAMDTDSTTSVLSAASTRTRIVKTPKHYDV